MQMRADKNSPLPAASEKDDHNFVSLSLRVRSRGSAGCRSPWTGHLARLPMARVYATPGSCSCSSQRVRQDAEPRGPGILPGCLWREYMRRLAHAHALRRGFGRMPNPAGRMPALPAVDLEATLFRWGTSPPVRGLTPPALLGEWRMEGLASPAWRGKSRSPYGATAFRRAKSSVLTPLGMVTVTTST